MLLWLADLLAKDVRAFNVFGYLTLRAVLACMTALVLSFFIVRTSRRRPPAASRGRRRR
jgi:phospho-N-acetylmuramoyl-pentapeptide-transferase